VACRQEEAESNVRLKCPWRLRASLKDLRRFDETGGAQQPGCEHSSEKQVAFYECHVGEDQNVRYTTFARLTGATPLYDVASASELPAASCYGAGV
jgi:hypothetical protein